MSRHAKIHGPAEFLAQDYVSTHIDASADPYAGTIAANGKAIWTAQEAADNLNRYEVNFTFGNGGALDDGILTYGFWGSLAEVQNSYVTEKGSDGNYTTDDSAYIAEGYFAPFNADQQAMAAQNIQLWDDLIAVTFKKADSASEADITFGFLPMSPSAGAHTWFPQEDAWNEYYGTTENGKMSGDVWGNWFYSGAYDPDLNDFADTRPAAYAWEAITHELGHSLGLAHGGDYNASDDNDGDGQPDPITYQGDAYFFQDSQQYTIMSYFSGRQTGQAALDWDTGYFVYNQTPQVHDILAVQNVYGADYTTRAGDTVYGFHSNADRTVFDFTTNKIPLVTIWDGGGNDTLDLSGFNANNIIDINEGAFSSAGDKMTAEQKAHWSEYFGLETDADWTEFLTHNGLGPDGRPVDNIAIAYGATIENAIGGSGNDEIHGNAVGNFLSGNAGDDRFVGGGGVDVFTFGAGNDTVVGELQASEGKKKGGLSFDIVTDFKHGEDIIDLSGLDARAGGADDAFTFTGTSANKNAGQLSYKTYGNVNAAEHALGIDIHSHQGVTDLDGPVTVVFANVDGGSPDMALVLLGTSSVGAADFHL